MFTSDRRAARRLSCDIPAEIFPYAREGRIAEGRIEDIALGGVLIRCGTVLQRKIPYRLQLSWEGSLVEIDSRVAREVGKDPDRPETFVYGMVFNGSSDQEHRIRTILQDLQVAGA